MKANLPTCLKKITWIRHLTTRQKSILSALFFLILMGMTAYAIFAGNNVTDIMSALGKVDGMYLVGAVMVGLVFVALEGVMIWFLHKVLGKKTGMIQCIKYSYIGFFFSGITPSASGGQPVQLYEMNKDGLKTADSTIILMTVALIYKFVLVLIGVWLLIFNYFELSFYLKDYMYLYYIGLSLNIVVVSLILLVMVKPMLFRHIILRGERLCVRLGILQQASDRMDKIDGFISKCSQTVSLFIENKIAIGILILVTFIQRGCMFLVTYLVYLGFQLSGVDGMTIIMLQATIFIAVDMLPLPGAQGITELMYNSVFMVVFPQGLLAASLIVTRTVNFYLILIFSAGVYLINNLWKKRRVIQG